VLEDMEKVMPPRVHLVSIQPKLDEENQLALKMVVAGESRERGIELARRMEDSRRFAQTHVSEERFSPSTTGDSIQLNIDAIYVPETLPETVPAAAPVPATAPKPEISKGSKP
jgi:hypothetical protein